MQMYILNSIRFLIENLLILQYYYFIARYLLNIYEEQQAINCELTPQT